MTAVMCARFVQPIAIAVVLVGHVPVRAAAADAVKPRDPGWTAPQHADSSTSPLTDRPALVAGGRKLFRQRCASCHGDDASGTPRAPNLTVPDVQAQSDGVLFWKLTTGNAHRGMPAFSYLPDLQRWQLVAHLRVIAADADARRR